MATLRHLSVVLLQGRTRMLNECVVINSAAVGILVETIVKYSVSLNTVDILT